MKVLTPENLSDVITRCAIEANYTACIVVQNHKLAMEIIRDFRKELDTVEGLYTIARGSRIVRFENGSEIFVKSESENLRGIRANTVLYDSAITDPFVLGFLRQIETPYRDNEEHILEIARRVRNESNMRSASSRLESAFETMCDSTRRSLEDWINNNVKKEFIKMSFPNLFKSKPDPAPEQTGDTSELDEFLDTFTIK